VCGPSDRGMEDEMTQSAEVETTAAAAYEPPAIVELGTLAQLTLQVCAPLPPGKSPGAADGCTFLGVDVAS
jgi:hypothetical protein